METVKLLKGTIVKLNGFPCELAEDTEVVSATIAKMGLEEFLRWSKSGQQDIPDRVSSHEQKAQS